MTSHHQFARVRRTIRQTVIATAVGASLGAACVIAVVAVGVAVLERAPSNKPAAVQGSRLVSATAVKQAAVVPEPKVSEVKNPANAELANACSGQTWPNYNAACLSQIRSEAPAEPAAEPGKTVPVPYLSAGTDVLPPRQEVAPIPVVAPVSAGRVVSSPDQNTGAPAVRAETVVTDRQPNPKRKAARHRRHEPKTYTARIAAPPQENAGDAAQQENFHAEWNRGYSESRARQMEDSSTLDSHASEVREVSEDAATQASSTARSHKADRTSRKRKNTVRPENPQTAREAARDESEPGRSDDFFFGSWRRD